MRLLISNLNRLTTIPHVVALLGPFGLVTSAMIMMNVKSGYSEGKAVVEMEFNAGQMAISELNNSRFMNCFITVEETTSSKNPGRI
jgi:RNA recognition motif-containing protein